MTAEKARELIERAELIILDFDGPISPFMPAPLNRQVGEMALKPLVDAGVEVPASLGDEPDHLVILEATQQHWPEHLEAVAAACDQGEQLCAQRCELIEGVAHFISHHAPHKQMCIASNNTAQSIRFVLDRFNIPIATERVFGRDSLRPDLMKPHPDVLQRALAATGQDASSALFVGDSASDIQCAQKVGVRIAIFTHKPSKYSLTRDAKASFSSWQEIA